RGGPASRGRPAARRGDGRPHPRHLAAGRPRRGRAAHRGGAARRHLRPLRPARRLRGGIPCPLRPPPPLQQPPVPRLRPPRRSPAHARERGDGGPPAPPIGETRPMMSDLEIAQRARMKPIAEIAAGLGIEEDELELHGRYKAKVELSLMRRLTSRANGKYI